MALRTVEKGKDGRFERESEHTGSRWRAKPARPPRLLFRNFFSTFLLEWGYSGWVRSPLAQQSDALGPYSTWLDFDMLR